ncbi:MULTISPECIES: diguanylate cyclase [Paraburkholderia]|uniref:GGDEF domain-containing protein n=1 Tax=Paraburkholderia TaxID=1822464 RepID=UPI0022526F4A|nr:MULTISPECIES: diguanylate cyclase [Paraburkholderia]MCX4161721.1 GGDEF domain-containing protein [Paraburkholderia megapolitana]MDN7157218.1 GGDEF domain-containing protein [Paraburkholderia sp. CHISQ3]MDQ6494263.1 GGDEF domain-containing protein [Paraburkholderia megapolitana]
MLLAISVLMGAIALVLRGWIYLSSLSAGQPTPLQVDYTDFLMILDYVPTVILLSHPSGKPYLRSFLWIDSIQAVIIAYLVFVTLFDVVPFTYMARHPVSGDALIDFYNNVDVAMCAILVLRLFAATTEDERRFYRLFCWYMFVDTVLIALHNRMAGQLPYASYYELLGVVPNLFFCILVWHLPRERADTAKAQFPNNFADFLNIASPVIFTTALLLMSIQIARHYFDFGAGVLVAVFVLYGLRATVLQRNYETAQRDLQQARDRLEALSLTDALTGLANRRAFDRTLETEWLRAVRANRALSLLMIDIDHFKALNDRYGHQAGDRCLAEFAQALRAALPRRTDLLARYGGEEFAAILPDTDRLGANIVARSMQESVNQLRIENRTSTGRYASISIGIATFDSPQGDTAGYLLQAADRALYAAKEKGRNRIEAYVEDDVFDTGLS